MRKPKDKKTQRKARKVNSSIHAPGSPHQAGILNASSLPQAMMASPTGNYPYYMGSPYNTPYGASHYSQYHPGTPAEMMYAAQQYYSQPISYVVPGGSGGAVYYPAYAPTSGSNSTVPGYPGYIAMPTGGHAPTSLGYYDQYVGMQVSPNSSTGSLPSYDPAVMMVGTSASISPSAIGESESSSSVTSNELNLDIKNLRVDSHSPDENQQDNQNRAIGKVETSPAPAFPMEQKAVSEQNGQLSTEGSGVLSLPKQPSQRAELAPRKEKSEGGPANLFVFHLPSYIGDEGLYQMFASFGPLESVKVITDRVTGESKGYGFVKFYRMPDAVTAIKVMNGHQIGNKHLKVNFKTDGKGKRT